MKTSAFTLVFFSKTLYNIGYIKKGDDYMQVSKEDLLHIAKLAHLKLKDEEIEEYLINLQDILNYSEVINNAPVNDLDITIGTNNAKNVFRKDEVKEFEDMELLLQNAPTEESNMFKIPKVIQ